MLWYNNAQGGGIILNQSGLFFKKKKIHMRIKFFLIALAVFLIGVASIFLLYGWFMQKQERVLAGTARAEFPYNDYSIDELNKMYPQYANENVKTTQTPEETYDKFRAALKRGDIGGAEEILFYRYKSQYHEIFVKAKQNNNIESLYSKLNDIKKINCTETNCEYIIINSDKTVNFIKNSQGVWLIESL
jgi:hypothetical protein